MARYRRYYTQHNRDGSTTVISKRHRRGFGWRLFGASTGLWPIVMVVDITWRVLAVSWWLMRWTVVATWRLCLLAVHWSRARLAT